MTPSIEVLQDDVSVLNLKINDSLYNNNNLTSIYNVNEKVISTKNNIIGDALINHIKDINLDNCQAGDEDSFFVADLGEVYRSYQTWETHLPRIHAHYAIKCNTDPKVIKLLGNLGSGFDCASKNEIDTVLNLGFQPDSIVYANPCKTNSFIRHARDSSINLTTIDNCQELIKMKQFHPDCGILIRIATDDESAQCRLSTKFGCSVNEAINEILPLAKSLDLNVKGVAFHVGSGAKDFTSIYKAIEESKLIFDKGLVDYKFPMSILDIGGGFEKETFEQSSSMVNFSIDKFFPIEYINKFNIKFIAEPGRFMVANSFTLATNIIARRDLSATLKESNDIEAMIYINDGVYGNMNCILFDHQHPSAFVLMHKGESFYNEFEDIDATGKGKHQKSTINPHQFSIWGPTCDGLDCVSSKSLLGANVQVGDWLYFPNLGAYTSAATTSFNGFKGVANIIHVSSEDLSKYNI